MPEVRPGNAIKLIRSGGTITHGSTVFQANHKGVAVKQVAESWKTGYGAANAAPLNQIINGEQFLVITKGQVLVDDPGLATPAVGDAVYITAANAITKTATANFQYGRIAALAGTFGVPTGKVRIDLDAAKNAVAGTAF